MPSVGKPLTDRSRLHSKVAQAQIAVGGASRTLVIACGALAHELMALKRLNQWQHLDMKCLPAEWHNTPEKITPGIERLILAHRHDYPAMFVAYGDCGTGGTLDRMLAKYGIDRLPGAHCYAFFTGEAAFTALTDDELGSFYLTDYLARNFDRLILGELGIARHPELRDIYFAHYRRVVYLAQTPDPDRQADALRAADALGLPLTTRLTGLAPLEQVMRTSRGIIPIATLTSEVPRLG